MPVVVGLAFTAVKATRLRQVDRIELGRDGMRENRRFYLIDARDRMINGKLIGELQQVVADYSDAERTLRLELPDGQVVEGEIRLGDEVTTIFFPRPPRDTSSRAHGRRRSPTASGGRSDSSKSAIARPPSIVARSERCP